MRPTMCSLILRNGFFWTHGNKPHVAMRYRYEDMCKKPFRKISECTVMSCFWSFFSEIAHIKILAILLWLNADDL